MQIQKLINIKLLLMTVMIIVMFVGCQEGYYDTPEPDKSIAMSAGDDIVDLIQKMVVKDGSFDNIVDHCSEISIKYPYSVRINGELINVSSIEDVESIKLNYFNFRDDININYPVRVLYSDYSESVISNSGDLNKIQKRYNATLNDDDIECVDFIYPIEINLYNKKYQKTDLIVARNDYDMYRVFRAMDDLIVELDFPIVVESFDKERMSIDDNIKLLKEIKNVIVRGNKGEDDEVDFGDEDYPHKDLLTTKNWKVSLYVDANNNTSLFSSYVFNFKKDKTVMVNTAAGKANGIWEINIVGKVKILKIEFDTDETPLVWLNDSWEIKNNGPIVIKMDAKSNSNGNKRKIILEEV